MREKKDSAYLEDAKKEAADLLVDFSQFTYGYRVLFLIHRSKEGGETNNSKLMTRVAKGKQQLFDALVEMLIAKAKSENLLRIQMSVNERDIKKAIRQFKQAQLDADYYDDEAHYAFYLDVKNRWISAIMKPSSRAETYFLWDLDTKDAQDYFLTKSALVKKHDGEDIVIEKMYSTKNGWHAITRAFDPNLILADYTGEGLSVNKDGLLLLKY